MTRPSAVVIDLRNPSGLPFRAGMNFALIMSPALSTFEVFPLVRNQCVKKI
jgi:hypothetical protein